MLVIICAFSFNNKAIFILSTSCVYVFWVILTLNNKSFLQQEKKSIFFVEEVMCAFCETGFKFINIRLIKDTFLSVLSHFHFLFVSLSLPAFCNKLLTLNFDLEWADFFLTSHRQYTSLRISSIILFSVFSIKTPSNVKDVVIQTNYINIQMYICSH